VIDQRVLRSESRAMALRCATAVRALVALLVNVLREIGDENAYARFLAARGREPSAEAWREFSDERLRAKYVRPKCC
jgi:hypothetical protein